MNIERKILHFSAKTFRQRCQDWNFQVLGPILVRFFFEKIFKERLVRNIGAEGNRQVGQNCNLCVQEKLLELLVSSPCLGKIETRLGVWSGKETAIWLKSLKKNPIFFIRSRKYYGKISSTQIKVKNQWNCPFQYMFITTKGDWKRGCRKKTKVTEIIWNTKNQLSFQSSSAAALMKKLSDGKTMNYCGTSGHPFWICAEYRRFRQLRVKKTSHTTASLKVTKFSPCQLFATGMSNLLTVCPEQQFKVQTSTRKRNNYNRNWTNSWKFFEFREKIHGVWAKTFGSVVGTEICMSTCLSCEKSISEAKI